MNTHFIVKLVNGDTIYGRIKYDKNDDLALISDPLIWEDFVSEDGYSGSSLVRYFAGSDETEVGILKTAIISLATMNESYIDFYEAAVGINNMNAPAYFNRLDTMTASMYNNLHSHYANKKQKETGQLVAFTKLG